MTLFAGRALLICALTRKLFPAPPPFHFQKKWDSNKISWHKEEIHEVLKKHGEQVLPGLFSTDAVCAAPPKTVFVPLCGKTVDMAHLAASPAVEKVVGVDGILQALEAFAFEQPQLEIHPAAAEEGGGGGGDDGYRRLKGRKIELLQGDFFELDEELSTGGRRFAVIFDRASLIAIDPSLRERYVEITGKLLQPGGQILLVTLTRPDENGPPFSTPESAVRDLYEKQPWVESVTPVEHPAGEEVRDGGVWTNLAFLIQGKS